MSSLVYRSSKANQPSMPSAKTRKAIMRRVLDRSITGQIDREVGRQMYILAGLGHLTKRDAYGYHPTKSQKSKR